MKKNDKTALRGQTIAAIKQQIADVASTQAMAKLELSLGKHSNVHVVRDARKKRAVMLSVIREKELAGEK